MSTITTDTVHQGWLTKSPPSKGIFRPRWRRRWFLLRAGSLPHQFMLEYFTDESCRRQKGQINLDECEQIVGPLAVQDRHKFTFDLRTPNRTYYLAADSEAEMNKWLKCLCHVCGLKTVDEENDVYTKPSDENNKPESEENQEHIDSDDSSPTLSARVPSGSGPYYPLSECFTGKPVLFNDKPNGQNAPHYNATSFSFPPKVNWATHPTKKDSPESETAPSASETGPTAPPRPPKNVPSVITTTHSPQPAEVPKPVPSATSTGAVFHYDNVDELHDSSSTCSSLHSPPGSAGVLYSNISEMQESRATAPIYQNPLNLINSICQLPQMTPLPSPGDQNCSNTSPPRVDRNLKPGIRKISEGNQRIHQPVPQKVYPHSSVSTTLPNRAPQRQLPTRGPIIDRSRKPSDNLLTLDPTPAQVKFQSGNQISPVRYTTGTKINANTLPTNPPRRTGPIISPSDKKSPTVHEYEQAPELKGTYLEIDCNVHSNVNPRPRQVGGHVEGGSSVEYKLIDHVKTQALNQMRQEREEQLRTNLSPKI